MPPGDVAIKVDVIGIQKAMKNLARLEYRIKAKILRRAVRVGSNVLKNAVRNEAPRGVTGKLRQATTVKVDRSRDRTTITGKVDLNRKTYKTRHGRIAPFRYRHLVLAGTDPHTIRPRYAKAIRIGGRRGSPFVGKVEHPGARPNDYWGRAYDKSKHEALRTFEREFATRVEAEAQALDERLPSR